MTVTGIRKFSATVLATIALVACQGGDPEVPVGHETVNLSQWAIASSQGLDADGAAISTPGFDDSGWIPATVPGTVAGSQMDAGLLGNPFFGTALQEVPGWTYSFLPMPEDSPYRHAWWYRTEVTVPEVSNRETRVRLVFEGINWSADIWVNGRMISSADTTKGTFREFRLDITDVCEPGANCAIAAKVNVPDIFADLAIYWVDWNPEPPDYNMGLWMPARLDAGGAVTIIDPAILTDIRDDGSAWLTLVADLENGSDRAVDVELVAEFDGRRLTVPVSVGPRQVVEVIRTPAEIADLKLESPILWWPYHYGTPHLYDAKVSAIVDGTVSDSTSFAFGVREVTAVHTNPGSIQFFINGRPILIRGAGWAPDMLLRHDPARDLAELSYVRDLGLNTVRLEGKLEDHAFYDLADRMGILLMPGWCCCDTWESWDTWDQEDYFIADESILNQLRRLRRHASVFTWLNGSDFHPPPDVEQMYLETAARARWNLPIVSNATETPSTVSGPSGMKMTGPYNWVPPKYWYVSVPEDPAALADEIDWPWLYGGAYGFNSESSPGPAVPPLDSMLKMLPEEDIWPVKDPFLFHSGGTSTARERMKVFNDALAARLGAPTDAADYTFKAQVMAYESHRAMFEAQGRNKYFATGHIQWMLNNAWPGTIWNLYDYYLRPAGSYFGSKKALAPLHVQYSYDDESIWVVNSTLTEFKDLTISATIWNLDGKIAYSSTSDPFDVPPDGNQEVMSRVIPASAPLTDLDQVHFIDLRAFDSAGNEIDRNIYWVSTVSDTFDMVYRDYELPQVEVADMTDLAAIPEAVLSIPDFTTRTSGDRRIITQKLKNTGESIAFFIETLLVDLDSGEPILPAIYSDNYVTLMPGEEIEITVSVAAGPTAALRLGTRVSGWNVRP